MGVFAIPVHDLMRRPGNQRELTVTPELPSDLIVGIAMLPAGRRLEIELRLESVHEGILATGEITTVADAECSRCLDPVDIDVKVKFQELFLYQDPEEDDFLVEDEQIDLEQVVVDAIVLSLPFKPVCKPDCAGLCPECGVRLEDETDHQHEAPVDSRLAVLEKFKEE